MKRILIVDTICAHRSPTTRSWLHAAKIVLPRHFDEIEVWSMENDLDIPGIKFRKFPKLTRFWPIQCVFFRFCAKMAFRKLSREYRDETLIQCSGEHLPSTDIRYIQFWNLEFIRLSKAKPDILSPDLKGWVFQNLAARIEKSCLKPENTREWWCVSHGIAAPIRAASPAQAVFQILPNSYDPKKFNHETRTKFRSEMREHYGFAPDEIVFTFCSFGHFTRKGLPQAVQVFANLRAQGHPVRFLVLGGTPTTISKFLAWMNQEGISEEGIHFAGLVDNSEKHLSAADALFFPSHFEAFSLVEIEAAALGLRLYLTAHPGSEMIVREHINGRMLPWDIEGMTQILAEEIASGKVCESHTEMGDALSPEAYVESMDKLYQEAIQRKLKHPA